MADTFTKADIQKAQKAWEALPYSERQKVDTLVTTDIQQPLLEVRMGASCRGESAETLVTQAFKRLYPNKETFEAAVAKLRSQHIAAKDYTSATPNPKVKYGVYMSDFTNSNLPFVASDNMNCLNR